MQWHSLSEFLAMGGYGMYVWPSFGVAAVCMMWEVIALRRRHAAARAALVQPSGTRDTTAWRQGTSDFP